MKFCSVKLLVVLLFILSCKTRTFAADEAIASFKKALKIEPNWATVHRDLGAAYEIKK